MLDSVFVRHEESEEIFVGRLRSFLNLVFGFHQLLQALVPLLEVLPSWAFLRKQFFNFILEFLSAASLQSTNHFLHLAQYDLVPLKDLQGLLLKLLFLQLSVLPLVLYQLHSQLDFLEHWMEIVHDFRQTFLDLPDFWQSVRVHLRQQTVGA